MWRVDNSIDHHEMSKNIPSKLRPLMPRIKINVSPNSCSCSIRNPNNILQWTHHPISGDYVRREAAPLVSTRWNPTPEQLQALEEMYRRGIRTPSAEQIQQIAAKLRRFGKIEGKNVFYWFQNHKARERQKKRRQLDSLNNSPHHTKQTPGGVSRRYIETEHHKKLPTPSEESVSMQGAAKDGWTKTLQIQLHHKILTAENEASSALSPNNSSLNTLTLHTPTVPETTTLQLFPIHQSVREQLQTKLRPTHQFIEFLPTKN